MYRRGARAPASASVSEHNVLKRECLCHYGKCTCAFQHKLT